MTPTDAAFAQRAILARYSTPENLDAARQLRDLLNATEYVAWEESKAPGIKATIRIGRDPDVGAWVMWMETGVAGDALGSFDDAIDDFVVELRQWLDAMTTRGPIRWRSVELRTLVGMLGAMPDEQLRAWTVVRAHPEPNGTTFEIVAFHRDGVVTERAVPFTDGRRPSSVRIPNEAGQLETYAGRLDPKTSNIIYVFQNS